MDSRRLRQRATVERSREGGRASEQALQESLDGAAIDDDWTHYPHVTDQGCTVTIFERLKGRAPTQAVAT
jgi:hypothetical protein